MTSERQPGVLVLTSTYPRWPGDTEPAFVQQLAHGLAASGWRVRVLTPHCVGSLGTESEGSVEVHRYRYWFTGHETLTGAGGIMSRLRQRPFTALLVLPLLLGTFVALCRSLRSGAFDVVHAHWLVPQGILAILATALCRRPAARVLCTAHGGDVFALRGRLCEACRRWVVAHAAHVTAVSRYVHDELVREGADPARLSVASMGVDLRTRFSPVAGVTRDADLILFVGRLVEKKGVAHLIEAMGRLQNSFPAARLAIVGDGPERPRLERLVAASGLESTVRFLGARPQADLPALYSRAAIAVVPSIVDALGDQEGLGLVTIEAIGCGCAVVASDLPAIHDVIEHGVNGLLVRPRDAAALATALSALLRDPGLRARLTGDDVRTALCSRFDWVDVTRRYAAMMRQLRG